MTAKELQRANAIQYLIKNKKDALERLKKCNKIEFFAYGKSIMIVEDFKKTCLGDKYIVDFLESTKKDLLKEIDELEEQFKTI